MVCPTHKLPHQNPPVSQNDVAAECLGPFHRWLLCPFFYAGGRFTVDGVHYVAEGDRLVPAGKTPVRAMKIDSHVSAAGHNCTQADAAMH